MTGKSGMKLAHAILISHGQVCNKGEDSEWCAITIANVVIPRSLRATTA